MLSSLLLKLGLIKISEKQSLEALEEIHRLIADSMLKDNVIDEDIESEQRAEAKMLFWFLGGEQLQRKNQKSRFGQIVHDNIFGIIFEEVSEDVKKGFKNYTDDDLFEIYKSRGKHYSSYYQSKSLMSFAQTTERLLYKRPFSVLSEKESFNDTLDSFENDFFAIGQTQILTTIKEVVPKYRQSLTKLYKYTK